MTQDDSSVSATYRAIDQAAAQNKIDWTAVRTSTCSWTFEELSRYSHCRVSPYVFAVARALCSQFGISASARKELAELKQRLDTPEDDSSHHVLHMLTASDEGLTVLGVCGILNDYFHSAALAEFFETLAKMSGMPKTLRPARGRWMELARICGKIQPPASFHSLAQNCSRLGLVEEAENNDLEEGVGPIGVVTCIQGMSQISSGEDDGRIVMLCGRSAGWHAAIAEWMFGLRIKLTTRDGISFEGKTVHSNCQDDQVQLTLAFNNPGVPTEGDLVDDPPMPIKYQKED
jgi:hypothetical protein